VVLETRAAYYFTPFIRVKDLDTYAGVFLGYVIVEVEVNDPERPVIL
jgi:hypothetical protein